MLLSVGDNLYTGKIKKNVISGILADFVNFLVPNVMATIIIENVNILRIFLKASIKSSKRIFRDTM